MKWLMLLIAAVAIAAMLFLGLRLISSGESELDNETLISSEYNATSNMVNLMFVGGIGIPAALGIIAFIIVLLILVRVV
jgi:predicted DNA repair protein MutK